MAMLSSRLIRPSLARNTFILRRNVSGMATSQNVLIGPQDTGLWKKVVQTPEAAMTVTDLLQKDLAAHHVFFNDNGFHNHIVHHLLSLYGTGATASQIQKAFDDNAGYQKPAMSTHDRVAEDLQHWDNASQYLAKGQHYPDFLLFFQREIDKKGWEAVLSDYVLAGNEAADDLLLRLYAGFLHPLIQLMYGLEWKQPAIVAEALAQACVHGADCKDALLAAEKNANEAYGRTGKKMPTVVSLLREVHDDTSLANAVRMQDSNKIKDGVLKRAPDEMLRIISKVKLTPDELEERTVEMFDAAMFMAAGAALHMHTQKPPKFDFFLIHHINSAPFFTSINSQSWIPVETKVRLLEWKIRYDLIQYAGRGVPDLSVDRIKAYQPKRPGLASVAETVERIHPRPDDGHAIKLVRAAALGQEFSKKYQDRDWIMIKGDDMWMRIGHLIVDSLEAPGADWVRTAGLIEAWTDIPDSSKL